MRLHLLDRSTKLNDFSFSIRNNRYPNFLKIWHYHPEFELVTILKSSGTRFIGDNIEQFNVGEVVLIGKNLPHMWLNDKEYFQENTKLEAQAIAIHFKENFLGKSFFNIPEMSVIKKMFENAKYGVKFTGDLSLAIRWIKKIETLKGFDKTIALLKILNLLANHKDYKLLSSMGFVNSFKKTGRTNLVEVYEYIIKNFKERITLNDVANIACMNPTAFSRVFKRVNRKTFSEYLNEVRVGYACKLLMEEKYNISEICFESGFNNISNFNRQFKKTTGYSPTNYIKRHLSLD
ncbi:AraC family transcriptional regulator [Sabulilitoribacter arenilitoris]|uniref:AraC family transcriptional regulator n=1 Tax=Wocania arenilitoris TaxID=2044858 RepID=A0AAE3EPJ2_9FLAO|nr:AraC family transcriptional regulator [Wocania arenilitoris]MCF7567874.1 AraC family transcriptional regulator [Wocania arenilitoris]